MATRFVVVKTASYNKKYHIKLYWENDEIINNNDFGETKQLNVQWPLLSTFLKEDLIF